jgi:hypothetical protein
MRNDTASAAVGQHFSAPRGARAEGRLEFSRGAAHLAIHGASMEDLFGAHFDQPVPSVAVDGGTVTVQYPRFSPRGWLQPGARRGGSVTLNQDMAWHITVRGGVAHLDADLRNLRLEALELGQGASQVEVRLPRPAGWCRSASAAAPAMCASAGRPASRCSCASAAGWPTCASTSRSGARSAVGCGWSPPRPPRPPTATRSRSPPVPRTWRSAPRKEATDHDPTIQAVGLRKRFGKTTAVQAARHTRAVSGTPLNDKEADRCDACRSTGETTPAELRPRDADGLTTLQVRHLQDLLLWNGPPTHARRSQDLHGESCDPRMGCPCPPRASP